MAGTEMIPGQSGRGTLLGKMQVQGGQNGDSVAGE